MVQHPGGSAGAGVRWVSPACAAAWRSLSMAVSCWPRLWGLFGRAGQPWRCRHDDRGTGRRGWRAGPRPADRLEPAPQNMIPSAVRPPPSVCGCDRREPALGEHGGHRVRVSGGVPTVGGAVSVAGGQRRAARAERHRLDVLALRVGQGGPRWHLDRSSSRTHDPVRRSPPQNFNYGSVHGGGILTLTSLSVPGQIWSGPATMPGGSSHPSRRGRHEPAHRVHMTSGPPDSASQGPSLLTHTLLPGGPHLRLTDVCALEHLNSVPFTLPGDRPRSWGMTRGTSRAGLGLRGLV